MDRDEIARIGKGPVGAIFSAIVGSLMMGYLMKKWSRSVPMKVNGMGRDQLLKKHKSNIRIAERLLPLVGLILACVVMKVRNIHDLRAVGLILGLPCSFSVGWIIIANCAGGIQAIKEGMMALAVFEKVPPRLFFGLLAFCVVSGLISSIALTIWP